MRYNWNLARTMFGISLDNFRGDAIGFWLRQSWKCLKYFSMRCEWNLAQTRFGIVLKYFRRDAIGIWLEQNLEFPQNIFEEIQLEFG